MVIESKIPLTRMVLYHNQRAVPFYWTLMLRFLNWYPLVCVGIFSCISCSLCFWNNIFLNSTGHWLVNALTLNFMWVVGMALASHYLVEKPPLKLKQRFHKLDRQSASNNMNGLLNKTAEKLPPHMAAGGQTAALVRETELSGFLSKAAAPVLQRSLNAKLNNAMLKNSGDGQTFAGMGSLIEFILKIPVKAYNAAFTPMGRKNLHYLLKKGRVSLSPGYRRDGTLLYSLENGSRFVLHRGNRLSELIFLEGAYEPLETLIVSQSVRAGDVALDVGANVGYYTALLDGLVKPGGQVHSFEPGEGTFTTLEETKKLLKLDLAVLHQKAVGDSVGHIDFWSSTSGSDAQQSTIKNGGMGSQTRRHQVEATTLDAFAGELNAKGVQGIAFVKCDIEGAEPSMLKGAQNILNSENPPIWLIEHNRGVLLEHGAGSVDLVSPFLNCDVYFVPSCWPPSIMVSPQAVKWSGVPDELPDECNLIILPKRGAYANRAATLRQAGLIP
jgi:FkbM family methyltransferase